MQQRQLLRWEKQGIGSKDYTSRVTWKIKKFNKITQWKRKEDKRIEGRKVGREKGRKGGKEEGEEGREGREGR